MSQFQAIEPSNFPWFDYKRYTFSLGLTHKGGAWLSGHSASEYDAEEGHIVVRGDMEAQTRTAYAKIGAILEAAGLTPADVHRVVENVTAAGIEDYEAAAGVREEVFGSHSPALSTVVIESLLRSKALIEIEVTAGQSGKSHGQGLFEAGEIVYLPSMTSSRGDLIEQTEAVLTRASRWLEEIGLDMTHLVKTVDYTTPETLHDYKETGGVRKDFLGPVYPAAAGILMPRLQHKDALVSMDFIASRGDPVAVNPGWDRYEKLTYSPAVKAGKVLFMSGQAALDPATEKAVHSGDIAAQAEYTYNNIFEVLKAAGGGPEHLVKTIEYVTAGGLKKYREVAKVRERLLSRPYPASTGLVCGGLLRPEFEIEIDPLALLP